MVTFWIFALAMVIIALVFLLRPLLIDSKRDVTSRAAQNVAITKERLNELRIELKQETISQAEYEQTKAELEQALLNDVEATTENDKSVNEKPYNKIVRYIVMLSVPLIAVSLYTYLGQPDLIEGGKKQTAKAPAGHGSANDAGRLGTVEQMVEKLAAKLKENPNNAEGWFMLARSYMSMNRYKEAVVALEKTNQLIPNNPTVMLRYADALTMLHGGKISGKPFDLIKRAVAIKPDDPTGLWLIGMGYEEQGDYNKAISYWNLLLPLVNDDKSITEVQNLIRRAKSKAGINTAEEKNTQTTKPVKQSVAISLKVNVTIDKNMLSRVSATDTLFIFAKAVNGPPMPLAVVRKQVKDLPLQVTLDDSMAMIPSMKISNFSRVQVSARVSKSGQPRAQSGDVESETYTVESNKKETVKLMINKMVP